MTVALVLKVRSIMMLFTKVGTDKLEWNGFKSTGKPYLKS